jgi:6-phosphofructo-2-kinase / fructose-2,6-biphosphatase 3
MLYVQAMADFKARIGEYEKVYVPITDGQSNRHVHFIQLNNMVTGRGYMDINRISGYLPGKIVFFLMQARTPPPALGTLCSFLTSTRKMIII